MHEGVLKVHAPRVFPRVPARPRPWPYRSRCLLASHEHQASNIAPEVEAFQVLDLQSAMPIQALMPPQVWGHACLGRAGARGPHAKLNRRVVELPASACLRLLLGHSHPPFSPPPSYPFSVALTLSTTHSLVRSPNRSLTRSHTHTITFTHSFLFACLLAACLRAQAEAADSPMGQQTSSPVACPRRRPWAEAMSAGR